MDACRLTVLPLFGFTLHIRILVQISGPRISQQLLHCSLCCINECWPEASIFVNCCNFVEKGAEGDVAANGLKMEMQAPDTCHYRLG